MAGPVDNPLRQREGRTATPGDAEDGQADLGIAKRYLTQRSRRNEMFGGELFGEPAWDILLDLYCARLLDARVSVSDACVAAGVPTTTAFRSVRKLVSEGVVRRLPDPSDRRRHWLEITDDAARDVGEWLRGTWPNR